MGALRPIGNRVESCEADLELTDPRMAFVGPFDPPAACGRPAMFVADGPNDGEELFVCDVCAPSFDQPGGAIPNDARCLVCGHSLDAPADTVCDDCQAAVSADAPLTASADDTSEWPTALSGSALWED